MKIRRTFRLCGVLSLAISLGTASSVVLATNPAAQAFKQGKELQKNGQLVEAVDAFEKAARLDPFKPRYANAVQKAKMLAADHLASESEKTGLAPYARHHLLQQALDYVPEHQRARHLMRELLERRDDAAAEIDPALEAHAAGSTSACTILATRLRGWKSLIPRLPELESAADAEHFLQKAEDLIEEHDRQNLARILELTEEALDLEPQWNKAVTLRDDTLKSLEDYLQDRLQAIPDISDLRERAAALSDLQSYTDTYPLSARTRDLVANAEAALVAALEDVLNLLGDTHSPEARLLWGFVADDLAKASSGTDFTPPPLADPAVLSAVFAVEPFEGECNDTLLHERLQTYFLLSSPPWISRSDVDTPVRFEFDVSNVRVVRTDLDDADVEPAVSSYKIGEQYVTNPTYLSLQQQLAEANRQMDRIAYLMQQDPQNWGYPVALASWRKRANQIIQQMNNTPPQVSNPVKVSYQYEKFKHIRTLQMDGNLSLQIADRTTGTVPFSVEVRSEDSGVRGISPDDMQGHRNRTPSVLGWDLLGSDLCTTAAETIRDLALIEIARAHSSLACQSAQDGELAAAYAHSGAVAQLQQTAEISPRGPQLSIDDLFNAKAVEQLRKYADRCVSGFVEAQALISVPPEQRASGGGRDIVEKIIPSVVYLSTAIGSGTGFAVASDLVLTNFHVVQNAERIQVTTGQGDVFLGNPLRVNEAADLALIRVRGADLKPLLLDHRGATQVGDTVYAIGQPLGLSGTVTRGIVSAIRTWEGIRVLQVDASINPGNSGGPLVNEDGIVVGVSTLTLRKDLAEGIGFAVSAVEVRRAFGDIVNE